MHEPRLLGARGQCQRRSVTSTIRSARRRLRSRRGRRLGNGERTEFVLEFGGIEASASGAPITRTQLEESLTRPVRQHAEQIAEVGLRIEGVQSRRGDQREQIAGGLCVIVAADEQPRLASNDESPFILPMSAKPASCTIAGTQSSAARFRSHIAKIGAARRLPCASRPRRDW